MALDLMESWIHEYCRRGLLTDDVAASFSHFLMSPDNAQSTKRMIEGAPLVATISTPLPDQQRLCSPAKKTIQQPFRYCELSSPPPIMLPPILLPRSSLFPPEPSLPSPWREGGFCTRQKRQMMRPCSSASATGALASHRAAFVVCFSKSGARFCMLRATC